MEWRDIPGFEGRYEVSDTGLIRGIPDPSNPRSRRSGRVLRAPLKKGGHGRGQGYRFVRLVDSEQRYVTVMVHRAVALAFLGAPFDGAEVRHIDGDALNNSVANLAWGTHRENVADTIAQGRHGTKPSAVCARGHLKDGSLPEGRCRACLRVRDAAYQRARRRRRADERAADQAHARGFSGGA